MQGALEEEEEEEEVIPMECDAAAAPMVSNFNAEMARMIIIYMRKNLTRAMLADAEFRKLGKTMIEMHPKPLSLMRCIQCEYPVDKMQRGMVYFSCCRRLMGCQREGLCKYPTEFFKEKYGCQCKDVKTVMEEYIITTCNTCERRCAIKDCASGRLCMKCVQYCAVCKGHRCADHMVGALCVVCATTEIKAYMKKFPQSKK